MPILCIVLLCECGTWHSLVSHEKTKYLHQPCHKRHKTPVRVRKTTGTFPQPSTKREMKASFKSNKGALTRLSNQVNVRAETFVAIKSPGSATQLNESYSKFLAKCDFLHRAAPQLALEDEENSAAWMQAQDQLQPMQDTIECIYGDAQVQLGIGVPTPETGFVLPGAAKVRVCHNLKPWELSASATPSEFRRWRRKYEQYYLGWDIGVTNLPGQQATISGCVDRELEHSGLHT